MQRPENYWIKIHGFINTRNDLTLDEFCLHIWIKIEYVLQKFYPDGVDEENF